MKTKTKEWFKLNNKNDHDDDVEYSTNVDFFLQNQIIIVKTGKNYKFYSRIESKLFLSKVSPLLSGEIDDFELQLNAKTIHIEILAGKHGEGKLVN